MIDNISNATRRNWNKLNIDKSDKLTSRANKSMSKKRFIPTEYITNKDNIEIIQNIIDVLLKEEYLINDIIYSLGVYFLKIKGLLQKKHVQAILMEYNFKYINFIESLEWPNDENDIIGIVYQSLLYEGDKNTKGSYYTPKQIVRNMFKNLDFSNGQKILDPCCGSGAFLIEIEANPNQIFGIDNDPIAVFIAKINLLIKHSDIEFTPKIECIDYLQEPNLFTSYNYILNEQFDYIVTNPPWGGVSNEYNYIKEITSKERFSYFFVKSFNQLKENGIIRFLLPESVTNVKVHKDIRYFILNKCCIEYITIYDNTFSSVTTKYIDISCSKTKIKKDILLYKDDSVQKISVDSFFETDNLVFNFLTSTDMEIINKVKSHGKYNLSQSIWALGIVTGDNKNKISHIKFSGMEEIYTGKEIEPYILKDTNNYILYDRDNLQQVAKEEYYRADEKLVYKFISNKLTFAYDDKKRLFLNSANILIPKIPGMSIKTVLAFLNSELYQFLYIQLFGEIKMLKGNLIELPFPQLSHQQDLSISKIVDGILNMECDESELQKNIYKIFNITEEEIRYIRGLLYGKVA